MTAVRLPPGGAADLMPTGGSVEPSAVPETCRRRPAWTAWRGSVERPRRWRRALAGPSPGPSGTSTSSG